MDDAPRMCMRKSRADIADQGERVRARQTGAVPDGEQAVEGRSRQQFHGEEGDVAVAFEFMHAHDVRVREQLQMLKSLLQLEKKLLALRDLGVQDFDRHPLAGSRQSKAVFVQRFEHGAGGALRDQCADPIPPA